MSIRSISLSLSLLLLASTLGACTSDDDTTPSSSSSSSGSSGGSSGTASSSSGGSSSGGSSSGSDVTPGNATTDLVFTGDIEATLKGTAGRCGGVTGGFSVTVQSAELGVTPSFELAMIILDEGDWDQPSTVINVKEGDKKSYVWKKATGTVTAARDRSRADFDVTLQNVVGTETVTVKGSVVCPPS